MPSVTAPERDAVSCRFESIGRLTAGVAHDFNNLITIMLGYTDLLDPHVQDVSGRELLDALVGAASQAGRLAEQLLALSRPQPPGAGPVDLSALVHDLAGLFRRVFSKQIAVVIQTAPGLRVRGCAGELMQVILNLCVNARDAMPRGGTLTLRTEIAEIRGQGAGVRGQESGSGAEGAPSSLAPDPRPLATGRGLFVQLRVADTGVGIAADVLPRIFEPYYTTRPGQGNGIGLATVRRIVEEHGGWVECTSEPGRGSSFDVYLPLS